jgi:gentisate 1,2-dioxygenase
LTTRRFSADEQDLDAFYGDIAAADLQPLWKLAPMGAEPPAFSAAHVWRWKEMRALAERGGDLVTIDRGGDRRVLALCNPFLEGRPYATSTLWGAVQYLRPGELAPAHRHTPGALRFVLEGTGVWTQVNGDSIAMAPGDLVLTPSWTWHEHYNTGDGPMIWFDGLDLPLLECLDAVFFEFGPDDEPNRTSPEHSASEASYGASAGLVPVGRRPPLPHSPLLAYRWADTDRALDGLVQAGRGSPAAIRFADPTSGADVMPTMRCEMHRVPAGRATETERAIGSSIFVVYSGACAAELGGKRYDLATGDMLAVPSFAELSFHASETTDLFRVSDAPVIEALGLDRAALRGEG